MAAARSPSRGLSTDELESIRDTLAAGRKPKVVFTEAAGQIAGQLGQVVQLTDPALSDEWVVVRFGRDELPFSPVDLAIPAKSVRAAKAVAPAAAPPPAPEPEPAFMITRDRTPAVVPAPRKEETVPDQGAPAVEAVTPDAPPPPARKGAAKAARPKATPALTVTLAYADGEWTVAANQGTKALAKPYLIRPTEALKMVGLLDVPAVHEAVEQILTAERAEAQQQAERLRAQLAEVEAKLADLNQT